MRRMILPVTTAILGCTLLMGQAGVKDFVRNSVDSNVQQHNQALEDEMNQDEHPQQQQQMVAPEQVPQTPLKTGWINRKAKDGTAERIFFAEPAGLTKAHPAPGLLLLEESWGLNDEMQDRAKQCAQHGYYAVAPDFFAGKTTDDPNKAAEMQAALADPDAMKAMRTALDLLMEEEQNGVVDAKRVGVVGWGLGARQALLLATTDGRIHATAVFYGALITDWLRLKEMDGPVFGVFAAKDKVAGPKDVDAFVAGLQRAGKTGANVTIYRVDDVTQGFASKSAAKSGAYNEQKANDANAKLWTWLDGHLKPHA